MILFSGQGTKEPAVELARTTPEDIAETGRLVKEGVLASTKHPSDETMAKANARLAEMDVEKEIAEAERWANR